MNPLRVVKTEIIKHLTGKSTSHIQNNLIRHDSGDHDLSFLTTLNIWKNYLPDLNDEKSNNCSNNILLYRGIDPKTTIDQALDRLKVASRDWEFHIYAADYNENENRCLIYLDRSRTYRVFIDEILNNDHYAMCNKFTEETIYVECEPKPDFYVTEYRMQLVAQVMKNIISYSKFVLVTNPAVAKHKLYLTTKSNSAKNETRSGWVTVVCGVVLDKRTNKTSTMETSEYLNQRYSQMYLTAIHKYGKNVRDDEAFKTLMNILATGLAAIDLLEVKCTSHIRATNVSTKAFILYNSARLETLMHNFKVKIQDGYYPPLPHFDDIDLELLREEEEWKIFRYLIVYPELIENCICNLHQGKVPIHTICKYVSELVALFSIYYRRVRLLTEHRTHLLPVLFAKIYLMKAVQKILNRTLALFDIDPVQFM
ncbi:unnamed protein product [Diamesa serratosioi]